jgi:hypothetical protein
MKVIAKARQMGKTTQLLYTSATVGMPIVVSNRQRVEALKAEASKMGLEIPTPMTFTEFTQQKGHFPKGQGILIDESQEILSMLVSQCDCTLKAITVTTD